MNTGPIKNSYWVREGKLAAGEYPGAMDPVTTRTKLSALLDAGIRLFLDLTEQHELVPYEPVLRQLAAEHGIDITYRRMPIPDVSVPSIEQMRRIQKVIAEALAADIPVYVHCWGGVGRTGTVVGCYLVETGMTGKEALARLAELWQTMEKRYRKPRTPETWEQEEFVRQWKREA